MYLKINHGKKFVVIFFIIKKLSVLQFKEVVSQIVDLVKNALDRCQPEHSADLIDRGIVLAGGGALIRGLDQVISDATGLSVIQAEDPLCCVANGTGKFLNLLGTLTREQVDRLVTQ